MKTSKISLSKACDIAIKEGKVYRDNLSNKRFLVIYRDKDSGDIMSLEVVFRPSNYQHLTGLDFYDENGELQIREAYKFYRKCVRGQLLPSEIGFHDSYTSLLKLECLPRLMEFTRITRIAGRYNETKPLLEGDYQRGGYIMTVYSELKKGQKPSRENIEEIRKASEMNIVADDDAPEYSYEELVRMRNLAKEKKDELQITLSVPDVTVEKG